MRETSKIVLIVLSVVATQNLLTGSAPVVGDTAREVNELLGFLSKYGYLQTVPDDNDQFQSDEIISNAIRTFQKFTGLEMTGVADNVTMAKMKKPRCGSPDVVVDSNSDGNVPFAYNSMGRRWGKNSLTWRLTQASAKLREQDQISAIEAALNVWAEVTPLTFQQTPNDSDIEMKFGRREHGDGIQNSFDGEGRVLAHAYGPGYGLGGDAHFDEDETWTIGSGEGADLIMVAAHEFGHSLGLGHSSDPDALMAPFYTYSEKPSLKKDDIQGIQSLYGPKTKTPRSLVPTAALATATTTRTATTAATPRTTTRTTTARTTTAPTTTTSASGSTKVSMPAFCDASFRLDAISGGPDGFLYAFRDDSVYKIGERGLESGYPKLISQVFPKAPKSAVNAATYIPETRKTYIFKDFKVWRYTNFSLDVKYPKIWTDVSEHIPSAVMTLTYRGRSQMFMFGNDYFWEWNPHTETLVPGYPLVMQKYFPHTPELPDAAFMNSHGHFFFFKGNSFKQLEHRGKDADVKPLGPNLFGPVCGGDTQLLTKLGLGLFNNHQTTNQGHAKLFEPAFSSLIWNLVSRKHKKEAKAITRFH